MTARWVVRLLALVTAAVGFVAGCRADADRASLAARAWAARPSTLPTGQPGPGGGRVLTAAEAAEWGEALGLWQEARRHRNRAWLAWGVGLLGVMALAAGELHRLSEAARPPHTGGRFESDGLVRRPGG